MITVSALPSSSGSAFMSPWRRLDGFPAASSFTRASRSISDERSMPMASNASRPNSSIIRPVPVRCRPGDRAADRERAADGLLDLALGHVERADLVPDLRVRGEIARRGFGSLVRMRASFEASASKRALLASSAQASISSNMGAVRSPPAIVRKTQLPSLRRSTAPASARMRTWRETRGWLCPGAAPSSPTDSSILRNSARITQPRRVGESL